MHDNLIVINEFKNEDHTEIHKVKGTVYVMIPLKPTALWQKSTYPVNLDVRCYLMLSSMPK